MNRTSIVTTMKHYVGKARTLRNEARARRFLDSLPPRLRADIGWPDLHCGQDGRLPHDAC